MKLFHDSASFFLHLLLLAGLFVRSSSRPVNTSLCSVFASVIPHLEKLLNSSKKLHDVSEEEVAVLSTMEHRLDTLPQIEHTASHFGSMKVNESLSQLYVDTQSFKHHVDWLKTAKHNHSLPSQSAEGTSTHLLHISNLIKTSLKQVSAEVPELVAPSLPVVPTAFDVLRISVELSERLRVFGNWSKRLLKSFQRQSRCPRH
ncbi:uncharacterized protein il11b [Mugil cephalus]|uniref:uncharacterized protein il11b n=1 Tax=Mugil cephalus TaxID=48193 RepID=UPI001FB73B5A|nr:uncharacterized protein il11b [Mugil cephalus]